MYKDFNEELLLTRSRYIKQREYWLNKLSGEIVDTELGVFNKGESPSPPGDTGRIEISLPFQLGRRIMKLSYESDIVIYIILLAGFKVLLHRYINNGEISVVSPISKPDASEYTLNGYVYIRDKIDESLTFKELLLEIRQTVLDAYENQDYPVDKLLEYLFSDTPKENIRFISHIGCLLKNIHGDRSLKELKCNLVFSFQRKEGKICGAVIYDKKYYETSCIERIYQHYERLMRNALQDVNIRIADISMLSESEKKELILDFNDNKTEFPLEKSIIHYIEDYALRSPGETAVVFEGSHWTYRQLNRNSSRLAWLLRDNGIAGDQPVGIQLDRSPLLVESILATWKAGGAYIPIETGFPVGRTAEIMNDSGARILLTRTEFMEPALESRYKGKIINLDHEVFMEKPGSSNPDLDINMNSLAYIIYTSGSTGKPKGAMVEHIGMMNHIRAKVDILRMTTGSIVAQNASHTFDISVWQFFAALTVGGAAVIYPQRLILEPGLFISRLIDDRVTILEVVPSYLSVMLDWLNEKNRQFEFLDYLLVTGEEVKHQLIKRWFEKYPGIKMVNAYGPTEASDDITHFVMERAPGMERIPIGKPLQNLNIYIVNQNMRLCPPGVTGEICVSGIGVGRGYLNDLEKTTQVFRTDPFRDENNVRLYKTGDLGCWLPDGTIAFFGRKDYQVKIRGFRIELGEIESKLMEHPGVREAVVIDKEDEQGNKYLCAYLIPHKNFNPAEIKGYLSEKLPGYMVPAYFVELERMPLTSNGKIHRQALPEPDRSDINPIRYITGEELEELVDRDITAHRLTGDYLWKSLDDIAGISEKEVQALKEYSKQKGKDYYPLNHAQKTVYYIEKTKPGLSCENDGGMIIYQGKIERELLEKAINHAVYRNANLRTGIVEVEHGDSIYPAQYVRDYKYRQFDYFDFSREGGRSKLEKWLVETTDKLFDLLDSDLFYIAIIKISDKEYGYYVKNHHILLDGVSASLLFDEIKRLYRDLKAGKSPEDRLNPSHIEYIYDEKMYLMSSQTEADREFWLNYLRPLPEEAVIWAKKGDSSDLKGSSSKLVFTDDLRSKIHEYRKTHKISLFKIILSALSIYVSRISGLEEFIIGTVNHGRYAENHRKMMGMFLNFLPIKIKIDNNMDFQDFTRKIGQDINFIIKNHSKYPIDLLSTDLKGITGKDTNYFWNITLVGHPDKEKRDFEMDHISSNEEATPLTIHINCNNKDIEGILELEWVYQLNRFSAADIMQIHQKLMSILTDALDNPGKKLPEIEFPAQEEKEQVLAGCSDTQMPNLNSPCNIDRIERLLQEYGPVEEAAVVTKKEENSGSCRCAYVVSRERLTETELEAYLAQRLPLDREPLVFVQLEKMPLKHDGKVDRKILETIKPHKAGAEEFIAPRNNIETKLAEIWQEVLGIDKSKISIESNFFKLGGHSLKAITLLTKIHKAFNVKIPLAEVFKAPVIKELGEYIKRFSTDKYRAIEPVEKKEYYELSSAQKRLFILQHMDKSSISYNITETVVLAGAICKEKLEETFKKLIKRHESLRTSFYMVESEPVQKIAESENVEFKVTAARVGNQADNRRVKNIIGNFIKPFDLFQPPLIRVGLVEWEETKQILIFDLHHIVSDGTSMAILMEEFMTLYEGKELPALVMQYKDYSAWQDKSSYPGKMKNQEQYWLKKLDGELPVLNLPLDYSRPTIQSFEGNRVCFTIPGEKTKALNEMAQEEKTTLYMVLIAVYYVLLYKLSGQEDLIIGAPTAGRGHADIQKVVGMFINTLALRNFPGSKKSFKAFLKEVKETTLEAFENQDYQFEDLVEQLDLKRNTGRNPLFDVMFLLQNVELPELEIPGVKLKPFSHENNSSKFDLSLYAVEAGGTLNFHLTFCTKLFKQETIQTFVDYFKNIVSAVVENPNRELSEIEIITGEKKAGIISILNRDLESEANELAAAGVIQSTLHETLSKFKDRTAIEYGETTITYAELDMKSNYIANRLVNNGIKKETFIGILTDDRMELIMAIFGILKAGCVFIPLDSSYPRQRLELMMESADINIIIGNKANFGRFPQQEGAFFLYDDLFSHNQPLWYAQKPNVPYCPGDMAYVYFTSGSTGTPKAIVGKNISLLHFINWEKERFNIGRDLRASQLIVPSFDPYLRDIFVPLCSGGVLCIPESKDIIVNPDELIDWVDKSGIQLIHCVPGLFRLLSAPGVTGDNFRGLKYILLSGEKINPSDLIHWYEIFDERIRVVNLYGPTETTLAKIHYLIEKFDVNRIRIPIGNPIKGSSAVILDENLNICPPLVMGEICIRTPFRSYGYYGNPQLNKEKFIRNPFNDEPGDILYRTGDLGRFLPDGTIDILGRIGRQVKIRGRRIELEEIENYLTRHSAVKEAAVIKKEISNNNEFLCAYIAANPRNDMDKTSLISMITLYLSEKLPEFMVPANMTIIDKIPRNPNGKVDYNRLPDPVQEGKKAFIPPANEVEKKLAEIWSEILGLEEIGIHNSYFEFGGNSLNAVTLLSKIHKEFNIKLSLRKIFSHPTIAGQAKTIKDEEKDKYVSLKAVEKKDFYLLSSAQKRVFIEQHMNPGGISYNMPRVNILEGEIDEKRFEQAFRNLVHRHESFRTSFMLIPDGESVQRIHGEVEFKIEYYKPVDNSDKSMDSPADSEGIVKDFVKPFDLKQAPLLRVGLIKTGHSSHVLMVDRHHIISDATSFWLLVKEFMSLYSGETISPLKIQYKDFAEWQNRLLKSGEAKKQEDYWLDRFSGKIPPLDLPTDYPRPLARNFEGRTLEGKIDEQLTRKVKMVAAEHGATLYMFLLAISVILLSKYSDQSDIIVGTPLAGRTHADLEHIAGMFVNVLLMRNNAEEEKGFDQFLEEVKHNALQAFDNQDYPFDRLVAKLGVKRDTGRNALYEVVFAMQNVESHEFKIPGLSLKPFAYSNLTIKTDLRLAALEEDNEIGIILTYSTALFKKETAEEMVRHFIDIAAQVVNNRSVKLKDIKILKELSTIKSNSLREDESEFVF